MTFTVYRIVTTFVDLGLTDKQHTGKYHVSYSIGQTFDIMFTETIFHVDEVLIVNSCDFVSFIVFNIYCFYTCLF